MEIKYGDRSDIDSVNMEKRRKEIVDNYKHFMPDIEDHIYGRRNKKLDFSFLYHNHVKSSIETRFNELAKITIDIRNNTKPTTFYSNSISKTDNRFSNETKKMIKHLLAKGWTNNEIAYEMEKIYGSGSITYNSGLVDDSKTSYSGIALCAFQLFVMFKVGKYFLSRIKNKKL
jgi:hypothetical protein